MCRKVRKDAAVKGNNISKVPRHKSRMENMANSISLGVGMVKGTNDIQDWKCRLGLDHEGPGECQVKQFELNSLRDSTETNITKKQKDLDFHSASQI